MAGGRKGSFKKVVANIRALSAISYVTVGVVLTAANKEKAEEVIQFADSLGVQDIRVIPAAQEGERLPALNISEDLLKKYPILAYRLKNIENNVPVRGIPENSTGKCGLALDDMAVMGGKHYPCIIHLRENGSPIGDVGKTMREDRFSWFMKHDAHLDPICKKNCLDVCQFYNQKFADAHPVHDGYLLCKK
jgi:MoaA/NifB/PqqE/SkfB family radical SAM enzyme